MDKAKHGEASYLQLIIDAKNNGAKVMCIDVNIRRWRLAGKGY
jgi:hypothetical protein